MKLDERRTRHVNRSKMYMVTAVRFGPSSTAKSYHACTDESSLGERA